MYQVKQLLDAIAFPFYSATGKRPWAPGYFTAKKKCIEGAVQRELLSSDAALPSGYGFRLDERVVEYPWVLSRIPVDPGLKVLDAGSVLNQKYLLDLPPLAETKLSICTLAPEKRCYWRSGISYIYDDLRSSMLRSEYFDVIISISTIEHIGLDNTLLYTSDGSRREDDSQGYRSAVREFRRMTKLGGRCLITVPYGKAVVRNWFQVFDAAMVENIVAEFQPRSHEIEYFGYHPDGWRKEAPENLVDATFFDIHQDGRPTGDMAAGARAVVCLQLDL